MTKNLNIHFAEVDGATGASPQGHALPTRDMLPYLKFVRVFRYGDIAIASFTAPEQQGAGFGIGYTTEGLARALRAEQHERENGMPAYELPWFQYAHHQASYLQRSIDRQSRRAALTESAVTTAWTVTAHLGGAAALAVALLGSTSLWIDYTATAPFNQAAHKEVANTQFVVGLSNRTAAIGSPDQTGYSWNFSASPHTACRVAPVGPRDTWVEKKLRPGYETDCAPVELWPETSPVRQLYAPAFTAYLQASKPAHPPELVDVQRALVEKRAFDALQLR